MQIKTVVIGLLISIFLLGGGVFLVTASQQPKITGLDDFARCLTASGAVMYGSAGCSYCRQTKNDFGQSFQYITYVECPANPQACLDKGIDGYPTWILGDGTLLEGYRTPSQLAQYTACQLPASQP